MMMTDGKRQRIESASLDIYREGELCSGPCRIIDGKYIRSATGVIEGHTWSGPLDKDGIVHCDRPSSIQNQWLREVLNGQNDTQPRQVGYKNDEDSRKTRAKHMATWIMHRLKWPTYE